MMYCQFRPHKTPGRFVCKTCEIPSSRNKTYGPEGPPPRHCPQLPEPYSDDDKEYILGTLCPECKHYHWPDKSCHCKCSKGTSVELLVKHGRCPAWRW